MKFSFKCLTVGLIAITSVGAMAQGGIQVPIFPEDIYCMGVVGAGQGPDYDRCVEAELKTRDEIKGMWDEIPEQVRQSCALEVASRGRAYVALKACLESGAR